MIIHIDLDAFYAQVEQVRLGLPASTPLAVQQWGGLIAVNYAARPFGIKRSTSAAEARSLCPEIHLQHVATFRGDQQRSEYRDSQDYRTDKACLDTYRKASRQIMQIFKEFVPKFERASIDEAYFDLTSIIDQQIHSGEWKEIAGAGPTDTPDEFSLQWSRSVGVVIDDESDKPHIITQGVEDLKIYLAASFCVKIRKAVFDRLQYTCSAGVAPNKTLAKIASGMNKPNNQTVIRPCIIASFMRHLKIDEIRFLGGKFGDQVLQRLGVQACGDAWKFSVDQLKSKFGDAQGIWLYNIVRGICDAKVAERNEPKSMGSTKSFRPRLNLPQEKEKIKNWISTLSCELYSRVLDEYEDYRRWPRIMTLHLNGRSKVIAFPSRHNLKSPSDIAVKANSEFSLVLGEDSTANGVSIICSQFESDGSTRSIQDFFSKAKDEPLPVLDDSNSILCPKGCGRRILVESELEHADWHLAKELALEMQELDRREAAGAAQARNTKRPADTSQDRSRKRKQGKGIQKGANKRIDSFFSLKEK